MNVTGRMMYKKYYNELLSEQLMIDDAREIYFLSLFIEGKNVF